VACLNKRSATSIRLTNLALLMLLAVPTISAAGDYTPEALLLTVYADGNTIVEYRLTVDPNVPRVTTPLFGQIYLDMLITDGGYLPLDYTIANGNVTIDTLGATSVNILYTTPDLIDKDGAVWTIQAESEIPFSISFPEEAIIVGMSSIPLAITDTDNHYIITMNAGYQTASYSTGIVGTKEQAEIVIKNADIAIEQARAAEVASPEADSAISDAKQAYSEGRYIEAEQAANQAIRYLDQAATQTTKTLPSPQTLDILLLVSLAVAGAVIVALIILLIRKKDGANTTYEKEVRRISAETIFRSYAHLRLEDKEAIQYLADSGGEVFETELREKFKLPKTTIWRQVRRLQREGLVEVQKIGGQNLIRIKEDAASR
jgi:uncharacterized membrane protein